MASPQLILTLLLVIGFSLATWLGPGSLGQGGQSTHKGNLLALLLGDGRRMFADHFFTKADVYFHGGYYPSIFDATEAPNTKTALASSHEEHDAHEHEKAMDFLGPPRDWIERFGRNFFNTEHTELEGAGVHEILPWLRISAELDPERVDTYTVAAYWLRKQLGRVKEAEAFLREGLLANPGNAEILTELGRLYYENLHDPIRARNVCELALRKWEQREAGNPEPDWLLYREITAYLAHIEEKENNFARAVRYLEMLKKASPVPAVIQRQIDELRQREPSSSPPPAP